MVDNSVQPLRAAFLFSAVLLVFGLLLIRPFLKRLLRNQPKMRWFVALFFLCCMDTVLGSVYCALFQPPHALVLMHGSIAVFMAGLVMPWEDYPRGETSETVE